jgi:hypothetical protein
MLRYTLTTENKNRGLHKPVVRPPGTPPQKWISYIQDRGIVKLANVLETSCLVVKQY